MNKPRRKQIDAIIERLNDIQADIEAVLDDETDYRDNIPENLQSSERYETADEACDYLDDAGTTIDDIIDALNSAKGE